MIKKRGNWFGVSYLRSLFKHWVRKDRLLRVDAINAERDGAVCRWRASRRMPPKIK
jgi:hypothetical protein